MFKNITLEMSLKPFKSIEEDYIEKVCKKLFKQWSNLTKEADTVSILLWSSDGSEILEYSGRLEDEFEWARYIGGANPRTEWNKKLDPKGIGLHTRNYLYMDNPPKFTYGVLKRVIEIIKKVGSELTGGKTIRVGATFDPGPEFAKSDFKYRRHEEICMGDTMGGKSFVCCYALLHKEDRAYAGFSEGIEEGTPFGRFFGRQCNHFLKDLNFDYIWLSNGFGFGTETWGTTGAIFDGRHFKWEKFQQVKENILNFWKLFREECPDIPIETRGTNLSAAIDLSSDGVSLRDIYRGNYNMLPPPNSPWAALDGDFGLELIGYMSRISELPGEDYLFRYYVHDPWWMNSPWLDRYEGQPHDIYLPLAVARINSEGEVKNPSHMNFLTIDNSLGEMPDQCPNEVIPHILKAEAHFPDEPSPLVWVYPFEEYHDRMSEGEKAVREIFFGDWFMRSAVNSGFPLSTVVSTGNFISSLKKKTDLYKGSVLVSVIPVKDSEYEKEIIKFIRSGGKVIFYGPAEAAGQELLEMLNIDFQPSLSGKLLTYISSEIDKFIDSGYPELVNVREFECAGGADTVVRNKRDPHTEVLASIKEAEEGEIRVAALFRADFKWQGGAAAWVRGISSNIYKNGHRLLVQDDPKEFFPGEVLMRLALSKLGYDISFIKQDPSVKTPVTMISRNNNAYYFSGYVPDTTAALRFRFPLGAPLLLGCETKIADGFSTYHMPRAWHKECRVFIEQESNETVSCREMPPVSYQMKRRVQVSGLKGATIRIFPEIPREGRMEVKLNSQHPYVISDKFQGEWKESPWGSFYEIKDITGSVMISEAF